jgi:predicted O-methyltransferase YrrM
MGGDMQRLTIITPCSRPENLPAMRTSIEPGRALFEIDWIIVFDGGRIDVEGARTFSVIDPESKAGYAQRNYGIEKVIDGWVYFLDDDNIIHPDFFANLSRAIGLYPRARGAIVTQDLGLGVRNAAPNRVNIGEIDLAQYVLRRDLIGSLRFRMNDYSADGAMIMGLFWGQPHEFIIDRQPLSYYNRLRGGARCPVVIYQDHNELRALRAIVRDLKPKRILEIGSMFGGTLWCWMQDAPGANITNIDVMVWPDDPRRAAVEDARRQWPVWANESGALLNTINLHSTDPQAIQDAGNVYDFIFIDGGHDYETVKADYENYWPMLRKGGLMAFHDITHQGDSSVDVPRFWQEVRQNHRSDELVYNAGIWGIGLLWKDD